MFAFLVWLLAAVFGLAAMSTIADIALHWIFGPNLPAGPQELHNLLMKILKGSAKLILGPFDLLKHFKISIGGDHQDRLPPPDTPQLTKQ